MIRFLLSAFIMLLGLLSFTTAAIGNYRFSYILNRMQASSISDTLGSALVIISLIIAKGIDITSAKLLLLVLFLWFANPVAAHFLAKTEIIVDENIKEQCEVVYNDSI